MPSFSVDAVLFDLDGTLVDSTASVNRNWRAMAARLGLPEDEVVGRFHGQSARDVLRVLLPDLPEPELDALHADFAAGEVADTYDVVATPGATDLLAALAPSRWAVVTSCPVDLTAARLKAAGLPFPTRLVTREDTELGKPDPAPYLLGARRVGYVPHRCLVVEDAPPGVASARAAGCPVVGLRTTYADLAAPTVRDLTELRIEPAGAELRVTLPEPAPSG
jgi:sugar-phosphatase